MLMSKLDKQCPVPTSQQPWNEFQELRRSYSFEWTTSESNLYKFKLLTIWLYTQAISSYIAAVTINFWSNPIRFFVLGLCISTFILLLILIRIYLGWSYVSKRLLSATIAYEESGWYDGQIWIKTPQELVKDRLLAQYTLKPILHRLKVTIQCLLLTLTINCCVFLSGLFS